MAEESEGNEGEESGDEENPAEENLEEKVESEEEKPSRDGAVALIRIKGGSGKEEEFYFEEKKKGYFVKEYVGRLSLVGGAVEEGEDSLDALVRELEEEFRDPEAAEIVKKNIKGLYCKIEGKVEGYKPATVHVYEVVIDDPEEARIVRRSPLKGDGDYTRIVPASKMEGQHFAWGYDLVMKDYLLDRFSIEINPEKDPFGEFRITYKNNLQNYSSQYSLQATEYAFPFKNAA